MNIVTTQEIHRDGCPVRYAAIIDGVVLKTPSGEPYAYTTEKMAIKNAARALAMGWQPKDQTMTAEQLEELLATNPITSTFTVDRDEMYSLARRVIAAEKLVEALEQIKRCEIDQSMGLIEPGEMVKARIEGGKALTAYREASK